MVKMILSAMIVTSVLAAMIGCSKENPLTANGAAANPTIAATTDYPSPILKHVEVNNKDNKVFLFTLLADPTANNVYLKVQTSSGNDPSTYAKGNIALGSPSGYTLNNVLAAGKNTDGTIWVFSTANSGSYRIWYRKQTSPGATTFTAWKYLPTQGGYGNLAVSNFYDGTLAIFYRSINNYLNVFYLPASGNGTYGQIGSYGIQDNFIVGKNSDGRLEVFTPWSNEIDHIWQQTTSVWSWYSYWAAMPTPPSTVDITADMGCILNQSNGLEVYMITADQKLYNSWFTAANGWASWNCLVSQNVNKRMTVGKRSDGGMDIIWTTNSAAGECLTNCIYQLHGQIAWSPVQTFTPSGFGGRAMILSSYISVNNLSLSKLPSGKLGFFCPSNYLVSGFHDINMGYSYENGPDDTGWSYSILCQN
jgi:hypothetical protein